MPKARFTAVVDLPTPPFPEATAMIAPMPGMFCLAGRWPEGDWAGAWEWACAAGCGLGAGAAPALRSAVRLTSAPLTPGMALTARSAA